MRYSMMAATMVLGLAACDRAAPPVDKLENAAEEVAEQADDAAPRAINQGAYAPRDECGSIAGAGEFRKRLANAVEARDVEGLVALADKDVKLDFGGGAGAAELRTRLAAADPKLWNELEALLTLGCAANKQGGITLPWYFAQDVGGVDPMMGMIVTGANVPMRENPDDQAKPVTTLSWDAVEIIGGLQPSNPYQHVKLPDGTAGYIVTAKLRSLIDYRLTASSRAGKWSFTSFIAGD